MNERLDELLQSEARSYNDPPPAPREEMWLAIQEARRGEVGRRLAERELAASRRWRRAALAVAAALVLGVGLGRVSVRPAPLQVATTADVVETTDAGALGYQLMTTSHLSSAEALLTEFRSGAGGMLPGAELEVWARELLSVTRLLLDSPAGDDPMQRALLQDLELILAQIAQLPARPRTSSEREDVAMVKQAIDDGGVLPKIREAIPAGPLPAETEEE